MHHDTVEETQNIEGITDRDAGDMYRMGKEPQFRARAAN
jgi:hypothetical protein